MVAGADASSNTADENIPAFTLGNIIFKDLSRQNIEYGLWQDDRRIDLSNKKIRLKTEYLFWFLYQKRYVGPREAPLFQVGGCPGDN